MELLNVVNLTDIKWCDGFSSVCLCLLAKRLILFLFIAAIYTLSTYAHLLAYSNKRFLSNLNEEYQLSLSRLKTLRFMFSSGKTMLILMLLCYVILR